MVSIVYVICRDLGGRGHEHVSSFPCRRLRRVVALCCSGLDLLLLNKELSVNKANRGLVLTPACAM